MVSGEKALPAWRSTATGAVRGNMADGLGFFGGGGNYSDSSESDSDAEDEREAAVAPNPGAGDEEGRSAKEKEGTQPKGEDDDDPPERDIADAPRGNNSSLPSFAYAMKSTDGVAASFTTAGAATGATGFGRELTAEQKAVAERKDDSFFTGNMGFKTDLSALTKAAYINLDISKARDVPRSVVQRLRGKDGRGLQRITRETGARVVCEQEALGHEDDEGPRRVMVVGEPDAVERALEIVDGMVREDSAEVSITVMCPAHCVGGVIGKGGVVIKKIQRDTAAMVVVHGRRDIERFAGNVGFNSDVYDEPLRKIECKGAPKAAKAASEEVKKIILQTENDLGMGNHWSTKRLREEAENDALRREDERFELEEKKPKAPKYGDADEHDAMFGGTLSEGLGLGRHW